MGRNNRSSKFYTTGLTNTVPGTRNRYFFFEIDSDDAGEIGIVEDLMREYRIDYFRHRTRMGHHWLSPTVINESTYAIMHYRLRHINSECPMTTLRVEDNKYGRNGEPNFYVPEIQYSFPNNVSNNSRIMCMYLNNIFDTRFAGTNEADIKLVRYPLPIECEVYFQ